MAESSMMTDNYLGDDELGSASPQPTQASIQALQADQLHHAIVDDNQSRVQIVFSRTYPWPTSGWKQRREVPGIGNTYKTNRLVCG
ncbi:hypothetical protein E4U47_006569 [Claviceps purpurea]|nr:hypothetical protein E4U47_006569 [Claviceps purpurea]